MRVLIVAPEVDGVDAISEVRKIQIWHDVAILHGTVTVNDVYQALQDKTYDSVYFAAHGGPEGIMLSGGAMMTAEDIAQAARQREVTGLFFAACATGSLASYAVRHGVRYAISSEVDLPDAESWKLASAFYAHQRNGRAGDFVGAYVLADSGDGEYALHINPQWVQDLQRSALLSESTPHGAWSLSRQEAMRWGLMLLIASIVLSTLLARLAGG